MDNFQPEATSFETGIYTLGNFSPQYPMILDFTYPISEDETFDVEIGAILASNNDLYASWKLTDSNGNETYGIDKIDYTQKYPNAYFETRVMTGNREEFATFLKFVLAYSEIPENTGYQLEYSKDYGQSWESLDLTQDTDRKILYSEPSVEATHLQIRVTANVSGNDSPSLESGKVELI